VDQFTAVQRRLGMGVSLANGLGAVLVFLLTAVLTPQGAQVLQVRGTEIVVLFVVVTGGLLVAGALLGRAKMVHSTGWLVAGRRPSPAERDGVLAQPWVQARQAFALWGVAALVFGVYASRRIDDASDVDGLRVAVAILMGGLMTSTLTYLITERVMRPVFALALAGEPPPHRATLGLRGRLVVFWLLGSGVPLLGIGMSLIGLEHAERADLGPTLLFLVATGTVSGLLTMTYAARLVADPLHAVQGAMARVQSGDVGVRVAVDDGTELGRLEAGFNEMVLGLAERTRLHDLFGRHVGPEVARQALERGVALGGEQREVTVLFVDLVASTALAAARPAAEVVALLNDFFDAVVRVVSAEGGWVDKFEGDGALCVFGAPGDQPDHAERALRAARALRAELDGLAVRRPGLDAGIGVSSGLAVAGNVGTEQRFEYTVIGDPVNEAARLTEAAKEDPRRVLASAATVERAGDEGLAWERRASLTLRGRAEATTAYAPVAVAAAQATL
jgi:adenylate cyclase